MNPVPRCFGRPLEHLVHVRDVPVDGRATKVAPQPRANASGLTGRSAEPTGVDFVTLPSSLVGEYCPFVSP
jgi:hypothetical protein